MEESLAVEERSTGCFSPLQYEVESCNCRAGVTDGHSLLEKCANGIR